ncbi:MAG TPA: conjugal transfer protein TraF, partial [Armatimonadota bacterium]|nr:conjugal transfer protein TraF [Armatimonadota bacterium]
KGCYFVATDHKDGFDSRYAAIGWICARSVLGVGRAVL